MRPGQQLRIVNPAETIQVLEFAIRKGKRAKDQANMNYIRYHHHDKDVQMAIVDALETYEQAWKQQLKISEYAIG